MKRTANMKAVAWIAIIVGNLGVCANSARAATVIWSDAGAATAWYTDTNWNPNTPSNAWTTGDVAQFEDTGSATTADIDMSIAPLSIGAIEVTSLRTRALAISNSSATPGTLTLNGTTVNGVANTILRNASNSLLTLTNGASAMGIELTNATNNIVQVDGTGGVTIDNVISGSDKKLTLQSSKDGAGITTGTFTISGTNTYTGGTVVTGIHTNPGAPDLLVTVNVLGDQSAANGGWLLNTGGNSTGQRTTLVVNFQAGSNVAVASGKEVTLNQGSGSGQRTSTLNVAGTVLNDGALNIRRAGHLNINGGVWTQNSNITLDPNNATTGTATSLTVNAGGAFTYTGSNPIQMNANTSGSAQITLTVTGNNATFTTGQPFSNMTASNSSTGAANINLSNGGTLKLSANVPTLTSTAGSPFNFTLDTGGGIIDTNGFSTEMSRAIGGAGGLDKNGVGSLTLSAANAYGGATTVNGGTLVLAATGSITNSPTIDVKNGAILDVSAQGGGFALGSSVAQTLKGDGSVAGDVNFVAGSGMAVDYNGSLIDSLAVSGSLNITNAAVTFNNLGSALTGANKVIATYGSLVGGAFASVTNLPGGYTLNYSYLGNQIALVSTAHPGDFDGDGDVDGADFVAWQTHFPTATGAHLAEGDADGDGDVDGADFVTWQTNFPFTPAPGVVAVPEPNAMALLITALSSLALLRKKAVR